ncbi:aspartate-semialdehyde dehydrogenase [Euzebya tangerina]|uniref:aspartate-semialdehyde dehydrogenase n=1 Tax=Euzebya tangerina TaxID=591198 RepID=UPI000E31F2F9|nr:aspartate-semialdehyde dehydrogenase [Euzebya tangerina]
MRVAIAGATGAVGQDLRRLLDRRDFPLDELVLLASERSAGKLIRWRDQDITVKNLADDDAFDGVDIALFSAGGGRSKEHGPRAVDAGAIVVDNSSAFRMDPDVPLVVTEVNGDLLAERPPKGIVANPNCTTMAIMLPLKALHDAFGLVSMVATSYQAAGGAGQSGIDELQEQVQPLLDNFELLRTDGQAAAKLVEPSTFAATIAFNVVPQLGTVQENGYTDEELKLLNESRKILGIPDLKVAPTCVRVPVVAGHSVEIRATFTQPVSRQAATDALDGFPGMVVVDLPTPLEFAGRDEVAVGRIREDLHDDHSINFWAVGDNLLKGAALNTVQIAEELVSRGVV